MESTKIAERDSNFELLRIIAMIMIVIWHLCVHGLQNSINIQDLSSTNQFIFYLIKSATVVAVNIYVFISAFYSHKITTLNFNKIFKLFFDTFIFSLGIYLTLMLTNIYPLSIRFLLLSSFPILSGTYWFVTVFMVLFVLSPFLNIVINNLSQNNYLVLISILFFIDSLWQFLYVVNNIGTYYGYSIFHFVTMYFIAAYIGKYGFIAFDLHKILYLVGFGITTLMNAFLTFLFSGNLDRLYWYNSPIIVISSYCLFMFFANLEFTNRSINFIAKYTFGIYLVHEQFLVRILLWNNFKFIKNFYMSSVEWIGLKIIFYGFSVYVLSWLASCTITNVINVLFNNTFSFIKFPIIHINQKRDFK